MLFFPNSKVNIGLNVISKRSDGYHNIETVFCPIGLADILEFVPVSGPAPGSATFSLTGIPIGGLSGDNLCIKAYHLLSQKFNLPAIDIHLHKLVPPGAGLGGGSSDAAFMLKKLNEQFELKLNEADLCHFASILGSDCAFFIMNRPLFGYERGNRFREIPAFQGDLEIAVLNPGIHVSTAEAYAHVKPSIPSESLEDLIKLPVGMWREKIRNDFEISVFNKYPGIERIKERMYALGAVYASMSGSGSSVYGLFKEKSPEMKKHFPGMYSWTGPLFKFDH